MPSSLLTLAASFLLAASVVAAQTPPLQPATSTSLVPPAPQVTQFSAADVRLLPAPSPHVNPFLIAQDGHATYLLELEPDRLLSRFRSEAGLEPKAPGYDGWEKDTIGGHSLGHYLTACAKMHAATGDARFKQRVDYIVEELSLCQQANTRAGLAGYVAAIPGGKKAFAEVAAGDIRSKGFDLNGIWVPWYTLHKQMAGLRDAHRFCDNQQALDVWRGLADFSISVVGSLTPEQLNRMLRCEHGGMNELAADLYAITKEPKYLELARRFNDLQVIDPLADGKDILPGLHSNTQIPKLIGAARQYELTGEERLASAARFFWSTMTTHHSYVTGGNSMNEYLGPPRTLAARLEGNTTETCNTYNMLKLSLHLHSWSGDAAIMDYYERALYNHILASKDPSGPGVCYFLPLRPGSRKPFQRPFDDFTCCVGSGMENHASYGDAIYSRRAASDAHPAPALFVNLFIASEVQWRETGITLRQETAFPDTDTTVLRITTTAPTRATLCIRHPAWAARTPELATNDAPFATSGSRPGSYIAIDREWKAGDVVRVRLPMELRTESAPDDPDRLAILHGPIVLAGDLGNTETDVATTPHLVSDANDPRTWITPTATPQHFRTANAIRPADLNLLPLYQIANQNYIVYWKRLSPSQWQLRQADIERVEAERREQAARTVDSFQPGEMQPERDHAFDGVFTNAGEHQGRRWRDAGPRGWFAFTMKVPETGAAVLVCTYWGSDIGEREFDISIDDTVIATQTLNNNQPNQFFDVHYPIPAQLTAAKTHVRVKFTGKPGKTTGGLFGCRTVRAADPAP